MIPKIPYNQAFFFSSWQNKLNVLDCPLHSPNLKSIEEEWKDFITAKSSTEYQIFIKLEAIVKCLCQSIAFVIFESLSYFLYLQIIFLLFEISQ